ncbi:MAG: signal peptidase II [Anaerovoracaceae bacterium]
MVYLIVSAAVIVIDQIVKRLVRSSMIPGDSIRVLGDFFRLEYVRNSGVAFGMFAGKKSVLVIVPLIIIAAALVFILTHKYTNKLVKYALVLIVSGGVSNMIDRIAEGSVTDMFSLSFFPPVFNVADIAVTLGCALLIVYVLFGEHLAAKAASGSRRSGRSGSRKKR